MILWNAITGYVDLETNFLLLELNANPVFLFFFPSLPELTFSHRDCSSSTHVALDVGNIWRFLFGCACDGCMRLHWMLQSLFLAFEVVGYFRRKITTIPALS